MSNTPYLTKGPALRDTHNTVWAPRRLLKHPHPLFKGTIARSVRSHGPAMQAWYRALRDYGVCKWTSIQPLSTQSLSLASWLCTPLCPHHIETALWHCHHWYRVYILLHYRFQGRGGGIYILINITSVTPMTPYVSQISSQLGLESLLCETIHRARISSVTSGVGLSTGTATSLNASK